MLHSARNLEGFTVAASDGTLGKIEDVLVDDERWAIRYFAVQASGLPDQRRVLISPLSIRDIDWPNMTIRLKTSREQIARSPQIDTSRPVTREHEHALHRFYDFSPYWSGPELWGYSIVAPILESRSYTDHVINKVRDDAQSHLCSGKSLLEMHVQATDGEVGKLQNSLFEDRDWGVRYLVVSAASWMRDCDVLIAPQRIERANWDERILYVAASRRELEVSEEYDSLSPPEEKDRGELYRHHVTVPGA